MTGGVLDPCRRRNAAALTRFWQAVEQKRRLAFLDTSTYTRPQPGRGQVVSTEQEQQLGQLLGCGEHLSSRGEDLARGGLAYARNRAQSVLVGRDDVADRRDANALEGMELTRDLGHGSV